MKKAVTQQNSNTDMTDKPLSNPPTNSTHGGASTSLSCSASSEDQLWNIAMLMDKYKVHEHTENSRTDESVEKLVKAVESAWIIINVLNMAELDRGESWDRANRWLETWGDFSQQNDQDHEH